MQKYSVGIPTWLPLPQNIANSLLKHPIFTLIDCEAHSLALHIWEATTFQSSLNVWDQPNSTSVALAKLPLTQITDPKVSPTRSCKMESTTPPITSTLYYYLIVFLTSI